MNTSLTLGQVTAVIAELEDRYGDVDDMPETLRLAYEKLRFLQRKRAYRKKQRVRSEGEQHGELRD